MDEALFTLKKRITAECNTEDEVANLTNSTREKIAEMLSIFLQEYERLPTKEDLKLEVTEKNGITFKLTTFTTKKLVLKMTMNIIKAGKDIVPTLHIIGILGDNIDSYKKTLAFLNKISTRY